MTRIYKNLFLLLLMATIFSSQSTLALSKTCLTQLDDILSDDSLGLRKLLDSENFRVDSYELNIIDKRINQYNKYWEGTSKKQIDLNDPKTIQNIKYFILYHRNHRLNFTKGADSFEPIEFIDYAITGHFVPRAQKTYSIVKVNKMKDLFNGSLVKLKAYQDKSLKIEAKKLAKKNVQYSEESLKKAVDDKVDIYTNKYYQCTSRIMKSSKSVKDIQGKMTSALVFSSTASTLGMYGVMTKDKEKNWEWYYKIGWILTIGQFNRWFNSKFIVANPILDPWKQKMTRLGGAYIAEDFLWSYKLYPKIKNKLYQLLHSEDKQRNDIFEKINELMDKKSLNEEEIFEQLLTIMNHDSFDDKFRDEINEIFNEINVTEGINQDVVLSSKQVSELSTDDMSIELLLEAYTELEYNSKDRIYSLGDEGKDRYALHRAMDSWYLPLSIWLSTKYTKSICLGQNTSTKALQVGAIQFGISTLLNIQYLWQLKILGQI